MSSVLDEIERNMFWAANNGEVSVGSERESDSGTILRWQYNTLLRLARLCEQALNPMAPETAFDYREAQRILHPAPAKGVVTWWDPSKADDKTIIAGGVTLEEAKGKFKKTCGWCGLRPVQEGACVDVYCQECARRFAPPPPAIPEGPYSLVEHGVGWLLVHSGRTIEDTVYTSYEVAMENRDDRNRAFREGYAAARKGGS